MAIISKVDMLKVHRYTAVEMKLKSCLEDYLNTLVTKDPYLTYRINHTKGNIEVVLEKAINFPNGEIIEGAPVFAQWVTFSVEEARRKIGVTNHIETELDKAYKYIQMCYKTTCTTFEEEASNFINVDGNYTFVVSGDVEGYKFYLTEETLLDQLEKIKQLKQDLNNREEI